MSVVHNPWRDLPCSAPFVTAADRPQVDAFNARAARAHQLRLEVIPEPYLGDPKAPAVFLSLNPGFSDDEMPVHVDPVFNAAARANLLHERTAWPFYLLDPTLPSPGQAWWTRRLAPLTRAVGDVERVASGVFVAEVHGYHSVRYRHQRELLPSQRYTIQLVRDAIARDASIVILRAARIWQSLVPELALVPTFRLRNARNTIVSAGNCPEGFDSIVAAVRGDG